MAKLQSLAITFGETAATATELTNTQIVTLINAIGTSKTRNGMDTGVSITVDDDNISQLMGYVKPIGAVTQAQIYTLTQHGLHVITDGAIIETEYYNVSASNYTLKEGQEITLTCRNASGDIVSNTGISYMICVRIAPSSYSSNTTVDQILHQFNVQSWSLIDGADESGATRIYWGKLNSTKGKLTVSSSPRNDSWNVDMQALAYPKSIDSDVTLITQEQKWTAIKGKMSPSHQRFNCTFLGETTFNDNKDSDLRRKTCLISGTSIAISGFELGTTPVRPVAGSSCTFSVASLLPLSHTKNVTVSDVTDLTLTLGVCNGTGVGVNSMRIIEGSVQLAVSDDCTDFSIDATCKILGYQLHQSDIIFYVVTNILSSTISPPIWYAVREALKDWKDKDWDYQNATGFTNELAAKVDSDYMTVVMRSIKNYKSNIPSNGEVPFTALNYFTQWTTLEIPDDMFITSISSDYVTRIYGSGSLPLVESFSMPNLTRIESGNLFKGNTKMSSITLDNLQIINTTSMPTLTVVNTSVTPNITVPVEDNDVAGANNIFNGCTKIKNISLPRLSVINCPVNNMFKGCAQLQTVNIATSNNGDTYGSFSYTCGTIDAMFKNCSNLETIHMPAFQTGARSVTGDISTFEGCSLLMSCDLFKNVTSFSTDGSCVGISDSTGANAKTYGNITVFKDCLSLATVDIGNVQSFNCANGENRMFENDSTLTSITLNNLTSYRAKDNYIFRKTGLTSIRIPNICQNASDIYGVTGQDCMFEECTQLTSVELPIPTLDAKGSVSTFKGCNQLTTVTMTKLTSMSCGPNYMFSGCSSLISINLPLTSIEGTDINQMFYNCNSLQNVSLNSLTTLSMGGENDMFANCSQLQTISLNINEISCTVNKMHDANNNLTTANYNALLHLNCESTNQMFNNCAKLTTASFNELLDITYDGDGNRMFYGCSTIRTVSFPKLTSLIGTAGIDNMFGNPSILSTLCSKLESVNFNSLETYKAYDSTLFENYTSGLTISMSALKTIECEHNSHMFKGCTSIPTFANLESIKVGCDDSTFANSNLTSISFTALKFIQGTTADAELNTFAHNMAASSIVLPSIEKIFICPDNVVMEEMKIEYYESGKINIFEGCTNISSINFGSYGDNNQPLEILGDASNMFVGIPLAVIRTPIENNPATNAITSRLTTIGSNLFIGRKFNTIIFPRLTYIPCKNAFTMDADRIQIGM